MSRYILGIHDGHNAAAALLKDGEFVYGVQEERIVGQKNFNGFPRQAIEACLAFAGIGPRDVERVSFASMRSTPPVFRAIDQRQAFLRESSYPGVLRRVCLWYPYYQMSRNLGWDYRLAAAEQTGLDRNTCQRYDHHETHAATAYYGLRQDAQTSYAVITADGYGDGDSASIWLSRDGRMELLSRTPLTDSLGSVYAYVTAAMGFTPLEHEYKLMGMAPYASPKYAQPLAETFQSLVDVDEDQLRFRRSTILPTVAYGRKLLDLIHGVRFDTVCSALQIWAEELLIKLVRAVVRKTGVRRILCAGGVFMNVKANKRLMEIPEVDFLGIFPSCGDESLCFGAAYLGHVSAAGHGDDIRPFDNVYLGNDTDEQSCKAVVEASPHEWRRFEDVETELAKVLAAGKPLARCKGRMEFGARALGNRSILADPMNLDVVRVINRMVKKRDFWMPFAPVVRRERMTEYFVNPKNFSSPYMMLTFDSKENFRDLIAAVHNADLTARPQVIEQHQNPDYYRLLQQFEALTGRGVLLNTSYNLHGFPICAGAREAMEVFNNSGLEYLNVGQYLVHKRPDSVSTNGAG